MTVLLSRRALCLGFGAAAFLPGAGRSAPLTQVERRSFALGTIVRVQAFAADRSVADRACRAALQAIHRVEVLMSLFAADSEISRLNGDGFLPAPDPWTRDILRQAKVLSGRSDGAFDVTVQPLWRLFRGHAARGAIPPAADVAAVRTLVGSAGLRVSETGLRLARPGMAVTLNGIAQGFAADRARDAMRRAGASAGLVDAGELAALGSRTGSQPWSVVLRTGAQGPEQRIALDACVATSADNVASFSADRRHHHIFDPATGWSPRGLGAVSVIAKTATLADAWSTAIMVGGAPLAGHALRLGDVNRVWLVDKNGQGRWMI